jgi:hypothetical protein
MNNIEHIPLVVGAIQYSIIYMLFGGGIVGAIVIYIVAKMLGR